MKRLSLLPLTLLLFATTALAQTSPTDPDTLKAILSEIRQVRQDLQTTTIAAQRAQILIYRVQAQESIVRRMQERADDARSKLAQIRSEQKSRAASIKQIEEKRRRTETPTSEQRDLEDVLAQVKARFDADANTEQETQTKLIDAEEQLRMEQAKLGGKWHGFQQWSPIRRGALKGIRVCKSYWMRGFPPNPLRTRRSTNVWEYCSSSDMFQLAATSSFAATASASPTFAVASNR